VQRLQTRPQFQAVLGGLLIAKTEHFALHRSGLTEIAEPAGHGLSPRRAVLFPVDDVWLGAMTPKRWARRAVTRNAIKRQIYSVSADFQHLYPRAAFVVRLRREFSRRLFISASSDALKAAVRDELSALLAAGAKAP
jgi:ribonuclease P protein component